MGVSMVAAVVVLVPRVAGMDGGGIAVGARRGHRTAHVLHRGGPVRGIAPEALGITGQGIDHEDVGVARVDDDVVDSRALDLRQKAGS
jgi:hypothetical protein